MKDRDANFFRPLWRRVVVTAICVGWAGLELYGRDPTWIAITLGLTAYAVWTLFITFPKEAPADAATEAAAAVPAPTESNDVPPET